MMKRILPIVCLLLGQFVFAAHSQTIIEANAVQVAWDEVTTLDNGDPIPTGSIIAYEVFVAPSGNKAAAVSQGEVTGTSYTVQLPGEGVFVVGVRTVRVVDSVRYESEINWSDENGASTPDPFLVRLYLPPAIPTGLRAF